MPAASSGSRSRDKRRRSARIHAPIGLDIGAVSPAEIAVAIMAQITERLHARKSEPSAAVKVAS